MILVTGATGHAGSRGGASAAASAAGRCAPSFAIPDKARALFGDAVELAVGDFADPRRGARRAGRRGAASCSPAPTIRVASSGRRDAIDAAAATGVRRIVKLSTIGAEPGAPVAFWDWHGRVEQHLAGLRRPRRRPPVHLRTCRTCSPPPSRSRARAGCTRPRARRGSR